LLQQNPNILLASLLLFKFNLKKMLKQRWNLLCLCLVLIVTCSWGFLVHRTTNQLAIYELPNELQPFFFKNEEYLVKNAPRPDTRRNQDSTEATKHFIDLEMYGNDAANTMPYDWQTATQTYNEDSLKKYGYVPYVIMDIKAKLTNAFKNNNKDSILFYAADLGHYIGDANVPLHTTKYYDGMDSTQKGLHSLWETIIPEIEMEVYNLHSMHQATYLAKPEEAVWVAIRRANALLPDVFGKEIEVSKNFTPETKYRTQIRRGKEVKGYTSAFAKAYATALKNTVNEQLIYSADLIADFWYTAWVDAGKPKLDDALTDAEMNAYKKVNESYKNNSLIQDKLLRSKQNEKSGD
jgi:S1/P1 Nuclease